MNIEAATTSPVLYRCFDYDANLLYIGATSDFCKRMAQHRTQSHWFPDMAYHTTEAYRTRADAAAAEKAAIAKERPEFNFAHNVPPAPAPEPKVKGANFPSHIPVRLTSDIVAGLDALKAATGIGRALFIRVALEYCIPRFLSGDTELLKRLPDATSEYLKNRNA